MVALEGRDRGAPNDFVPRVSKVKTLISRISILMTST